MLHLGSGNRKILQKDGGSCELIKWDNEYTVNQCLYSSI